jgi:superfamily II DNA or RNA helicase
VFDMFQKPAVKELRLRDYQTEAIEALRDGIRQKMRRQVLVAPTGAGKTVIASHLLREADRKNSYALFLVDRVSLVDQTSATLDSYGIHHGVVQGDHPRWEPMANVQVCSIQTLANRMLPREPSLICYDECHVRFKATMEFMASLPECVKVGLTATPFTKGMANDWDRAVNVRTTRSLINHGHLVEPTIYVARSPEDSELGLNSYGEFSDASATEAGIRIVGDVVTEWEGKVHEHFGGPAKTIVFSPTVEHGRELCAEFAARGYNFQQISYLDRNDDERARKIAEFRKPDSEIHGLISCGVLTKGFDVPDVRVGISCRPYRKSLSSHMQEIGRIMRSHPDKDKALWLCLARDSQVLTNRGLIPIQFVTRHDKVWDGENFVAHGGAICKGVQNVITYQGLTATEGHLVHTMDGWRTFGSCAREQIPITQTGFGRTPIRIGEDRFSGRALARRTAAAVHSCRLRMREVPLSVTRLIEQLGEWAHWRVSHLRTARAGVSVMALCAGTGAEASLRQSEQPTVSGLWWSRDQVQFPRGQGGNALDNGKPGHSGGLQVQGSGSHQSGWELRARKSAVAGTEAESGQPFGSSADSQDALVSPAPSGGPIWGSPDEEADFDGAYIGADCGAVERGDHVQEQAEVWDILDAGPRNRFTCNGLLVHNCHSGNVERFAVDMFDVWDNGVGQLSTATKRDSKPRERSEVERKEVVCPECSGAMRGPTCMACGYERPARSGIHAVEGELEEFSLSESMQPRAGLRAPILSEPRKVWEAAILYTFGATRKGPDHAAKWARGIFRGIYPTSWPSRNWGETPTSVVDPNALALIEREVKRYRKRKGKAA